MMDSINYKGKTVLVTGGCGSIGKEIVKQLLKLEVKQVRVFDNVEKLLFEMSRNMIDERLRYVLGDIRERRQMSMAMNGVDIVFHAAALKHVAANEYSPFEAVQTNVIGTQNVIESCIERNVKKCVYISTDKAVHPVNVLGASKLIGEKLVLTTKLHDFDTKFSCVRFGNVLDSDGSVIQIFRSQIKQGKPLTVTSDKMTRFFMSIPDAASLVLRAGNIMQGREVFVLKMPSMRIIDLANALIQELAPKYDRKPEDIDINMIGLLPGEKLNEALIVEEDVLFTEELEDMYVFRPRVYTPHTVQEISKKKEIKPVSSDTAKILTVDEIRKYLYEHKVL